MKRLIAAIAVFAILPAVFAAEESKVLKDIPYKNAPADEYSAERCKLDIYAPEGKTGLPVVVWFHGGGISAGNKNGIIKDMIAPDMILVSANYRLSPKVNAGEAIGDAADAVAWVLKNIESYGGDPKEVYVGGHSAGGYLSGMVAFDPKLLGERGYKNTDLAGLLCLSGQVTSHFQVRKDKGDQRPQFAPRIDEDSMFWYVDNPLPPVLLVVGDRNLEFPVRVEENVFLAATIKKLKTSPRVEIYELQGYDHGGVAKAATQLFRNFMFGKKK